MSTEDCIKKTDRLIQKLAVDIDHDTFYLSDDPDGSGRRAIKDKELRLMELQLIKMTLERDALRSVCEKLLAIVNVQNGNLHADINAIQAEAVAALTLKAH